MKTSEEINQLSEALAKAQGSFKNPDKNKTAIIKMKSGGSYSYKYADLPSILDATRKGLSDNGLSHLFAIRYEGQFCFLVGRLMHSSGQWVQSEYVLPRSVDPKGLAAEMTYGRRYIYTALVGIAADEDTDSQPEGTSGIPTEDDDRETAEGRGNYQQAPKAPVQVPGPVPAQSPIKPKSEAKPSGIFCNFHHLGKACGLELVLHESGAGFICPAARPKDGHQRVNIQDAEFARLAQQQPPSMRA